MGALVAHLHMRVHIGHIQVLTTVKGTQAMRIVPSSNTVMHTSQGGGLDRHERMRGAPAGVGTHHRTPLSM